MQKCPVCETSLSPDQKTYCSRACYAKAREVWHINQCETCGIEVRAKRRKRRFCDKCYYQYLGQLAQARRPWFTCQECGKKFQASPSQKRKYCSRACFAKTRPHNKGKKTGNPTHNRIRSDRPLTPAEKTARYRERRWQEVLAMPRILCACGCGTLIPPLTKQFKPAQYALGHNLKQDGYVPPKGKPSWNKGLPAPWTTKRTKGIPQTPQSVAKRTTTRRERYGDNYISEAALERQSDKVKVQCANCGKELERWPCHVDKYEYLFCDKACFDAWQVGENSPAWQGGIGRLPYPLEFNDELKAQIRERDNFTCQHCGKTQEEAGYTLPVHHIDHDKDNNDFTNLITVCHRCNIYFSYHRDESLEAFL